MHSTPAKCQNIKLKKNDRLPRIKHGDEFSKVFLENACVDAIYTSNFKDLNNKLIKLEEQMYMLHQKNSYK